MRLIDIGLEGYLVANALRAVVAQRLVRRICANCKVAYQPNQQEAIWLQSISEKFNVEATPLFHGEGCSHCNDTGYRGRIGVFEYLEIDSVLADALRATDPLAFEKAARQKNFRTLSESALELAGDGVTTIEEVFRISEQLAEESLTTLVASEES